MFYFNATLLMEFCFNSILIYTSFFQINFSFSMETFPFVSLIEEALFLWLEYSLLICFILILNYRIFEALSLCSIIINSSNWKLINILFDKDILITIDHGDWSLFIPSCLKRPGWCGCLGSSWLKGKVANVSVYIPWNRR